MAIVTRYFSTSSAGAADGTTWADRAVLFTGGAWSSVITAFDFSGSDSLQCMIGPGTHTITATLSSGSFSTAAPTAANPILLFGCDSSGVLLVPPDLDWVSAQAPWDDSALAVLDTTTNIATVNLNNALFYQLKLTASGRNGAIVSGSTYLNWCVVANSTANTAAIASSATFVYACVCSCTGSSYSSVIATAASVGRTRVTGAAGSSGNRHGINGTGTTMDVIDTTIIGCGGDGINISSGSTAASYRVRGCTIANISGTGFKTNSTASQTTPNEVHCCMITGCGAYAVDGQSAGRIYVSDCRFRDNTSGNLTGMGNYPTDINNYTTDSDDATEYVNTGSNDYRIKNTAGIWGSGYGAGDQPSSGGGGMIVHPGSTGGLK